MIFQYRINGKHNEIGTNEPCEAEKLIIDEYVFSQKGCFAHFRFLYGMNIHILSTRPRLMPLHMTSLILQVKAIDEEGRHARCRLIDV